MAILTLYLLFSNMREIMIASQDPYEGPPKYSLSPIYLVIRDTNSKRPSLRSQSDSATKSWVHHLPVIFLFSELQLPCLQVGNGGLTSVDIWHQHRVGT